MKEISIIIPCYNVERYIDACVESLVNQTFGIDKMELIFVNDASTDKTLDKLVFWEKQFPDSITIVVLTENSKQGTAKNIGMQYATGKYLGFVDSDDYVELSMFEKMYDLHQRKDVDWVTCGRFEEYSDGRIDITGPNKDAVIDLTTYRHPCFMVNASAPCGLVQKLYKREWLMNLGIWFPERIKYEDNFFGSIVNYYTKKIAMIKEPLYHYRINDTSTVQTRNAIHHLDRLKIEVMKLIELKNRGIFEQYKEDVEFDFLRLFFINTLFILLSKFDEIPNGIIKEMQKTTRELFPCWKANPLLQFHKDMYKECQLIDYPFVKGDRREVLLAYAYVKDNSGEME